MFVCLIVSELFVLLTIGYSIWTSNYLLVVLEIVMALGIGLVYIQCKKRVEKDLFFVILGGLLIINAVLVYVILGSNYHGRNIIIPFFFFVLGAEKFAIGILNRIHYFKITKKFLGK